MELLKQLREKNGYTKKFIGDYLKISPEGYSHYEKGIRQPSIDVLKKLSVLYDVSVDYLIGNDNVQQRNENEEDETNTIVIMGRNGDNRKIKLSDENAEKLKKLLELAMPDVLDEDF